MLHSLLLRAAAQCCLVCAAQCWAAWCACECLVLSRTCQRSAALVAGLASVVFFFVLFCVFCVVVFVVDMWNANLNCIPKDEHGLWDRCLLDDVLVPHPPPLATLFPLSGDCFSDFCYIDNILWLPLATCYVCIVTGRTAQLPLSARLPVCLACLPVVAPPPSLSLSPTRRPPVLLLSSAR